VKAGSLGLASKHRISVCLLFCCMFTRCHILFRLLLPLIYIHITCISLSLRRTSTPIHLTSVFGVLGTQETSCFVITGLLERDIFDLFLPDTTRERLIAALITAGKSTSRWPAVSYRRRTSLGSPGISPLPPASWG
jgi:hypothetical protein